MSVQYGEKSIELTGILRFVSYIFTDLATTFSDGKKYCIFLLVLFVLVISQLIFELHLVCGSAQALSNHYTIAALQPILAASRKLLARMYYLYLMHLY